MQVKENADTWVKVALAMQCFFSMTNKIRATYNSFSLMEGQSVLT